MPDVWTKDPHSVCHRSFSEKLPEVLLRRMESSQTGPLLRPVSSPVALEINLPNTGGGNWNAAGRFSMDIRKYYRRAEFTVRSLINDLVIGNTISQSVTQ